eukprot:3172460-Pyramimonas_sp.AAC.1
MSRRRRTSSAPARRLKQQHRRAATPKPIMCSRTAKGGLGRQPRTPGYGDAAGRWWLSGTTRTACPRGWQLGTAR